MLRRLMFLAFVALVALGIRSEAYESVAMAEIEGCCPCDDEDGAQDGCCSSAQCGCFPSLAVASAPRPWAQLRRTAVTPSAWALAREQRARDRHPAPPTRPPIG